MTERRLIRGGDATPAWSPGDPPEEEDRASRWVLVVLALVAMGFVALAVGIGVVVPTLGAGGGGAVPAALCGQGEVPEDLTHRPGRWLAVWCG